MKNILVINAAYHEAGHAVMAYQVGWRVGSIEIEGVGKGEQDLTRLEYASDDYTIERQLLVNCAGWQAGWKRNQGGKRQRPEYLADILNDIHNGHEDDLEGDDYDSIRIIRSAHPKWSDEQVIAEYKVHEERCWQILNQAHVWDDVELLAATLLDRGLLKQDELEPLLASAPGQ